MSIQTQNSSYAITAAIAGLILSTTLGACTGRSPNDDSGAGGISAVDTAAVYSADIEGLGQGDIHPVILKCDPVGPDGVRKAEVINGGIEVNRQRRDIVVFMSIGTTGALRGLRHIFANCGESFELGDGEKRICILHPAAPLGPRRYTFAPSADCDLELELAAPPFVPPTMNVVE